MDEGIERGKIPVSLRMGDMDLLQLQVRVIGSNKAELENAFVGVTSHNI